MCKKTVFFLIFFRMWSIIKTKLEKANQYILERRIPGCERFGRVWAVPEDAVKPKRLAPGVKPKRSSSVQNAARNISELFF